MMSLYLDLIRVKGENESTLVNLLDSLRYCENGFNVIDIINGMEEDLNSKVIVIEGFKSKEVFNNRYDKYYSTFRKVKVTFDEFDIKSVPNILDDRSLYKEFCDEIVIDKDYSLTIKFKDSRNIEISELNIVDNVN